MSKLNLDGAYDLKSSDDAKALYADWADSYDTGFGDAMGYVAPRKVAENFLAEGGAGSEPVLDVGAGTGLLAEHLRALTVDAIDLSPEMLEQAAAKGLYRDRIVGNLQEPLALPSERYCGIVSSGTFTHGHVGPECLPELLRIARPGALFACGVVSAVFDGKGFGSALARLNASGQISALRFQEISLYEGRDHDHTADMGLVMIFRKT